MITKITSKNASAYSVRYSEAEEALKKALGENMPVQKDEDGSDIVDENGNKVYDTITSLEKYFYYLPQLMDINTSADVYKQLRSEGRHFTILPLFTDFEELGKEELFEVNADKRTITVPQIFQANGISIQGDKYAETIYFKIDRFFDSTDFDTCDIFIEWTNAAGEKGISTPWVVKVMPDPENIMYIGWALSDELTKTAGQIKFALRFIQRDANDPKALIYSWSTLTQTATVKPSLDFSFSLENYMQELTNDDISTRISSSKTQLSGLPIAELASYIVNLPDFVDLDDDNTYGLKVQAKTADGGTISYYWRYVDQNGDVPTPDVNLGRGDDSTGSIVADIYEQIEFTQEVYDAIKNNSGRIIYTKEADGTYKMAELPSDLQTAQANAYYERFSECKINRVGSYWAYAVNSKSAKNSSETKSVVCVVPMPCVPGISTTTLNEKQIIGSSVYDAEVPESAASSISITVDGDNTDDTKNPGCKKGELEFVWYKLATTETGESIKTDTYDWTLDLDGNDVEGSDEGWIKVEEGEETPWVSFSEDKKTLVLSNTEENITNHRTIEGQYKAVVYNKKNGKAVRSEDEKIWRVSYAPEKPQLEYNEDVAIAIDKNGVETITVNATSVSTDVKVKINSDWSAKWNISDAITYQWYEDVQTEDSAGKRDPQSDKLIADATEAQYVPTKNGAYYCVVTNHKNGETATEYSAIFYVTTKN